MVRRGPPILVLALCAWHGTAAAKGSLDIRKLGLVYRVPGMDAVRVKRDLSAGGSPRFDLYLPARAAAGLLPAVVFVNGVGDAPDLRLKDWQIYQDWARAVAARGFAAIVPEARADRVRLDAEVLLRGLARGAAALGLDPRRVAVWSCSANVSVALPLVMDGGVNVRAAVFYYGAGEARSLRRDVPVLWVMAGKDSEPLIAAQRALWARAVAAAVPWTMVEAPNLPHAFDALDLSADSRRVVAQTLAFLEAHLGELPPAPAPTREREILAYQYGAEQDKALAALEAYAGDHPRDVRAWIALAATYRHVGRNADAERGYRQALAIAPDELAALRWLAILHAERGDCVGAAPFFGRAGARAFDRFFLGARARCEVLAGKLAAARATVARAIAAGASSATMHYNLGCALAVAGRTDEALVALEEAVADGFADAAVLARDPDLDSLRGHPRFRALAAKLR